MSEAGFPAREVVVPPVTDVGHDSVIPRAHADVGLRVDQAIGTSDTSTASPAPLPAEPATQARGRHPGTPAGS